MRRKFALYLLASTLFGASAPLNAQEICGILDGKTALDHFGQALANGGDLNGDGDSEILIGIPRAKTLAGTAAGRVHVYSPHSNQALFEFRGPDAEGEFGFSVSSAGDVNGDGFPDILAGAPFAGAANRGLTRVFSGSSGDLLYDLSSAGFGSLHGYSVSTAGDLEQDGFDDFIVGSPSFSGRVFVYSGGNGTLIDVLSGNLGALMGNAVAGGRDVNNDDIPDLLICSRLEPISDAKIGKARIHSGADFSILRTIESPISPGMFADSCAFLDDLNGDHIDDFAIGALAATGTPFRSTNGAFIFSGRTGALIRSHLGSTGDSTNDIGFAIAAGGDIDDDGVDDYLLGAPNFTQPDGSILGRLLAISGRAGPQISQMTGSGHFDFFASALAGLGDVNGDTIPDLAVGAPLDDDHGENAGRTFIVSPIASQLPPTPIVLGDKLSGSVYAKGVAFVFSALDSTKVRLTVRSTTAGFDPHISIEDEAGIALATWTVTGKEMLSFVAPRSDRFVLRVDNTTSSVGGVMIDTGAKYPETADDVKVVLKGNPSHTIPFSAIIGTEARLVIKPHKKKGKGEEFQLELRDPDGVQIDLNQYGSFNAKGKFKADHLPLEKNGSYSLRAFGFTNSKQAIKVVVDLTRPETTSHTFGL